VGYSGGITKEALAGLNMRTGRAKSGPYRVRSRTLQNVTSFVFNNFLASFPLFCISSSDLPGITMTKELMGVQVEKPAAVAPRESEAHCWFETQWIPAFAGMTCRGVLFERAVALGARSWSNFPTSCPFNLSTP
jgi:hypothetical protein